MKISPVLLCGGAGTRLWPLSRADQPKQLLRLTDERSMLAHTLDRFDPLRFDRFAPPIIVTGARLEAAVRAETRSAARARFIIEPAARSTAPAIAAAALIAAESAPDALLLATPADHHMARPEDFADAVEAAIEAANAGALITFGVKPDRAEASFGYIRVGPGSGRVRSTEGFVEKPGADTAEILLVGGRHLWNAGVFLFRADAILQAIERFSPDTHAAARAAVADAKRVGDTVRLASEAFTAAPSISIDHAVMERADNLKVVPIDVGWSDIGSWEALWRASDQDAAGVTRVGDVCVVGGQDCYARSHGPLVALAGVSGLAVVATSDAVLVTSLQRTHHVKQTVDAIAGAGRSHTQLSGAGVGRLHDRAHRLRDWLMEDALPLWAERGVDERGAFYEGLNLNGTPARDAVRRFRVQARQIYCFCHAAELGWTGPAHNIVRGGLAHWDGWRDPNGGWPHLIGADLTVQDPTLDAYDQAFALLAFAWAYRLTGDALLVARADSTLSTLDDRLGDAVAGGYWDTPDWAPPRRQNPHMHLLEANLALHAATGEERFLARARDIVRLFRAHFLDREGGPLLEFFAADWSPAPGDEGAIVEPGHQLEWAFLLSRYENVTGDNCGDDIARLVAHGWAYGDNPRTGLVIDEGHKNGVPRRESARCWVQTEALRAALVMRERGHPHAEDRAVAIIDTLLDRYLNVEPAGAWIDHVDEAGDPIYARVPVPASTLYHLMGAIAMCMEAVG